MITYDPKKEGIECIEYAGQAKSIMAQPVKSASKGIKPTRASSNTLPIILVLAMDTAVLMGKTAMCVERRRCYCCCRCRCCH